MKGGSLLTLHCPFNTGKGGRYANRVVCACVATFLDSGGDEGASRRIWGRKQINHPKQTRRNHGECVPAGGRGPLGATAAAQGQLLAGGDEAGQHPEGVPRGDLHLRGGPRGLRERREDETFLGGICAGEQPVWRAGGGGGRSPLPLLDSAVAIGRAAHRRGSHHRVALPLPQTLGAQPRPGTLAPRPRPVSGLYGRVGEGIPPPRPIGAQCPQQPGLSGLRAHIGERKRRRPAAVLRGGSGPYRRPHRDGAAAAVRGHSQHQLY